MSNPKIKLIGSPPTADHEEYLPPTQSQNPKTFASSTPNLLVSDKFVLTAHRCLDKTVFNSVSLKEGN